MPYIKAGQIFIFSTILVGVWCQKTVQEDPCKTKARIVPDATYCDRYWECQDGQPELYDCPNGLVYAGKNRGVTEGCDYPWRANYCEGKTQANGPIGRSHCGWLYGIFGHETSCTRYWTCWNGTATEQLCIGGLLYNENTHSCDWPENVDGCQKHPLCNDDANGNVPLGKSCNRYWQCQGGYPRLQRCPAMLVFDKRTLRCVVPPTDECEVPTTVPTPLDEDVDGRPNVPGGGGGQQQQQQHHGSGNSGGRSSGSQSSGGGIRPRAQPPLRPQQFQPSPQQQDYQQQQQNYQQQQSFQAQRGQDFASTANEQRSAAEPHINLPPGAIPVNPRNRPRN